LCVSIPVLSRNVGKELPLAA